MVKEIKDKKLNLNCQIKKYGGTMQKVTIYTDGACSGNPGPGGWGAILIAGDYKKEISGGSKETTNNIMELTAILEALKALKTECDVELYSDSAYCVNLITNWMYSWERNGWMRPKNQEVKNLEIIKQIFNLAHLAAFEKVKGHAGIEWNEYVDKLATGKVKILSNSTELD